MFKIYDLPRKFCNTNELITTEGPQQESRFTKQFSRSVSAIFTKTVKRFFCENFLQQ
jgi:hypothetical protein